MADIAPVTLGARLEPDQTEPVEQAKNGAHGTGRLAEGPLAEDKPDQETSKNHERCIKHQSRALWQHKLTCGRVHGIPQGPGYTRGQGPGRAESGKPQLTGRVWQNNDQQDQDQQNQDQQEQQQDQQQQQQQISKEDAERMLQALQQDEQELQEKLQKQKARAQRVRVLKDW